MPFLIDGYNLSHKVGFAMRQCSRARWEQARRQFLEWLLQRHSPQAGQLTVVFDAQNASAKLQRVQRYAEIEILNAVGQEADDLIEELIATEARPDQLTVVSSDRRIREAARHRGCVCWTSEEYLDWLEERQRRNRPATPEAPAKPDRPSDAELQADLQLFGDLENTPAWKELFHLPGLPPEEGKQGM
jgi:predicted RNA-binding protein with PIN domain